MEARKLRSSALLVFFVFGILVDRNECNRVVPVPTPKIPLKPPPKVVKPTPKPPPPKDCYGPCYGHCILTEGENAIDCFIVCVKDCVLPKTPNDYCKIGCASTLCSNITSVDHSIAAHQMETCADSCSGVCKADYQK